MKKILLLIATISISHFGVAQYQPVDKESSVTFKIRNFGFEITGAFTGIQGAINFDMQNPLNDLFEMTVDAATVNTENSLRDEHLKGASYFDVTNYPAIHFVSTRVSPVKSGVFNVTGNLTIREKTQVITFPFTVVMVNDRLQFKGNFKIKRRDFGVGGTSTVSNDLEVLLNVTAQNRNQQTSKIESH